MNSFRRIEGKRKLEHCGSVGLRERERARALETERAEEMSMSNGRGFRGSQLERCILKNVRKKHEKLSTIVVPVYLDGDLSSHSVYVATGAASFLMAV